MKYGAGDHLHGHGRATELSDILPNIFKCCVNVGDSTPNPTTLKDLVK